MNFGYNFIVLDVTNKLFSYLCGVNVQDELPE